MKVHALANVLLLTNAVYADYLTAKSRDIGNNVDLGHLSDVGAFHSAIGYPNGTSWEDITEYETFDDQDGADKPQSQSLNPSGPEATGLVRRDDGYCSDLTGITKMVCDNVPSRYWFWGAGGGLAIYYSPQALTKFLNDVAAAIQAGRNLRDVYRGNTNTGDLKRRNVNETNAIDYHFSLPYLLDHEGKPVPSSIRPGSLKARKDPDADADLKHDYVYSQHDGVLYYKASTLSFSPNAVAPAAVPSQNGTAPTSTHTLQARGRTSDYTINMIITKHSTANTVAKPSCLAKLLKYHLDASSERGRFSCRPIDNKGKWHATMHLMINHGSNNKGTYGKCCD